jgi:hypothetical protein
MNRNTRLTQIFIGSMVLAAAGSASYAGLDSCTLHPTTSPETCQSICPSY